MRVAICIVVFAFLLLVGFVATPGLFKAVNPEYLLALGENAEPLERLSKEAGEIDAKLVTLRLKISSLEGSIKNLASEAAGKQASMSTTGVAPAEIAQVGIEYAMKASVVQREVDQVQAEKKILEERKAAIEAEQIERRKKLETSGSDNSNIYLVTRALALGAIGALMSIFAKFLFIAGIPSPFEDKAFLSRMWASMAMGGVVAVVVVGLFLTGFISIFSNSTQNTGPTDFWKVTILCLFAGAFSDRLFQAASGRMDGYLRTIGKTARGPGGTATSNSHSRASRRRKQVAPPP